MDSINKLYRDGQQLLAKLCNNGTYDVYRPNYNSAITASELAHAKIPARVDPMGSYAEPKLPCDKYSVFVDRDKVFVGDMLVPNSRHNFSQTSVTVFSVDEQKEMVAFRSNRVGQLATSRKHVVYDNVAFDVFSVTGAAEGLDPEMEGSLGYETSKAAIWWRKGIEIGWRLIEPTPRINGQIDQINIWNIVQVSGTFPLCILHLESGRRG